MLFRHSRAQVSADKRRGPRGTARRNSQADGAESWRQGHEGRLGHFWLVRPEPILPVTRLET